MTKIAIALTALVLSLASASCARPAAPPAAAFRTVDFAASDYELPHGYARRSSTSSVAERNVTAALVRRGWVRDDAAPTVDVVVVPAVRQSALQSAGGIEWDPTGPEDRVLVVALRERATGRTLYETVVPEGAEATLP
jgi:hypothetical protein